MRSDGKYLLAGAIAVLVLAMLVVGDVSYGNYVETGAEGYNPLGQLLTGVYTQITFAYDSNANQFVTDYRYTFVRHWTYVAWWCATCYANILDVRDSTSPNYLYGRATWTMGSWNAQFSGYNEVAISTTNMINKFYVDIYVYSNGKYIIYLPEIQVTIPVAIEVTGSV